MLQLVDKGGVRDMMDILFGQADCTDIDELVRMRIAYMVDDFGHISESEEMKLKKQLPDYFFRKLGKELIAFVAKDGEKIVSVAYLHIIEMPANLAVLNGLYGEVLSVYTEPSYRGKGLCSQLMKNLVDYGKKMELGRIDLKATTDGYPIYQKIGFVEKDNKYVAMSYKF